MELIGILIFVFGLASSFYEAYQKKRKTEARKEARRFDASNAPSRMSENGVNPKKHTRQTRIPNRQQQTHKPKTLGDYLKQAQNYLDEVDTAGQTSIEELTVEKMDTRKPNTQARKGRNAGQQKRGQKFAQQSQALRAQKRHHQQATLNQTDAHQERAFVAEGNDFDASNQFVNDTSYSGEGAISSEGPIDLTGISNEQYFDQALAANDIELGKALQEMEKMYAREANRLDEELNHLFAEMEDPSKDLKSINKTKRKTEKAREIFALTSQDDLKRGILLKEILDKPLSKRHQA